MTEGPHSGDSTRRRPSWYGGGGAEHPADPTYGPPPSAADADGYGVPQPGYAPYGYGYSGYQRYSATPGYTPTPAYSPTPGADELERMHGMQANQAQSAATASLVLAIIGFFTAPFILGPLALWQAAKARRLGHEATPGRVLAWICTLWGIGMIVGPILLVLLAMAAATL